MLNTCAQAGIALLACVIGSASMACAMSTSDSLGAPNRTQVIDARCGSAKAAAYRALFLHATTEDMRAFDADPDTSIALQAAWERARVLVAFGSDRDKGTAESMLDADDQLFEVDRKALERFIHAAENRICVPIPAWWRQALAENYAYETGYILFENAHDLEETYFRRVEGSRVQLAIERSARMMLDGTDALLQCRMGGPVRIDAGSRGWQAIATSCFDRALVYAGYGDAGYPFQLVCHDMDSNRQRWCAQVWGLWGDAAAPAAGTFWHRVIIRQTEQCVAVFGVGFSGAYIEGFDAKNGTSTFRFSTNYWMQEGNGRIRPVQLFGELERREPASETAK